MFHCVRMFSYTSVGRNAACISVRLIGVIEQRHVGNKTETQSNNNNKKPAVFVTLYSLLPVFVFSLPALIHTVSRSDASQEKLIGVFLRRSPGNT